MFGSIWRFLLYVLRWLDFVILTIPMYLMTYLPRDLIQPFYAKLFGYWSWVFLRAMNVDLRVHQMHKARLPERYVLIANHPSALEDVGIPALFPVHSLAKIQVKDWFVVGRISEAAGTLYVDRDDKESRQGAIQVMIDAVNAGKNIALYPEGGCKGRRLAERFLFGAFEVSMQTGVPILPIFLHYEAQDDFEWQDPYTLIDKIWHFMTTKNNRANYYVFDPIYPDQYETKEAFNQDVYNRYLEWQAKYLE